MSDRSDTSAAVVAAIAFVAATVGAVAFAVVYALGPDRFGGAHTQALGAALAVALGGSGVGLVVWAHGLMPQGPEEEERGFPGPAPEDRRELREVIERDTRAVGRRGLLGRLLALALGATGIAALFPLRSLGRRPFPQRATTGWSSGVRLVTEDGSPVRVGDMDENSILTVFPEGHIREADAQTVLLRLPANLIRPLEGQEEWAHEGHVAYSKVCTHAGCPVGLYQVRSQRLLCPCHQSAFDVLHGARPIFGPTTRPLPQLPLTVDDDGYLVAADDYAVPVGPGFWSWPSHRRDDS